MPHVPVELTSVESFNISGRGTIYAVDTSKMEPGREVRLGDVIKLDGKWAKVTLIEFMSGSSERARKIAGIGVNFIPPAKDGAP
jgi:uncharacterized Zn finger protein